MSDLLIAQERKELRQPVLEDVDWIHYRIH